MAEDNNEGNEPEGNEPEGNEPEDNEPEAAATEIAVLKAEIAALRAMIKELSAAVAAAVENGATITEDVTDEENADAEETEAIPEVSEMDLSID